MADTSTTPRAQSSARTVRRVIFSSFLGSTIEYYDFLLYSTAASLVFPHVFFAGLDPLGALIASYATFATGYLARPLGGLVFGHFGDRVGRKKTLVLSMVIMGLSSALIGLIPDAGTIGGSAAVILSVLRFAQGIALGGEWGGAVLIALEHSDQGKRGFAASFANAGGPAGMVLGTLVMGVFATLPKDQFMAWGWRIPFLISFILLALGLYVRSTVAESPLFTQALQLAENRQKERPRLPLFDVLRRPKAVLLVAFACMAQFALQTFMSTFAVTYAVNAGADRSAALFGFSFASAIGVAVVVVSARLSDRFGRKPVILTGLLGYVIALVPLFAGWGSGNALLVAAAFLAALILHSTLYGPLAAFVSEQFKTQSRYTGASLGYQAAALIGGGFTPTILASVFAGARGDVSPVIWVLAGICLISALFIILTKETHRKDLTAVEH